jgi:hypothetical protein
MGIYRIVPLIREDAIAEMSFRMIAALDYFTDYSIIVTELDNVSPKGRYLKLSIPSPSISVITEVLPK